jgi:hypothetical protein
MKGSIANWLLKLFLIIILSILIASIFITALIKDRLPENIFYFEDIGTYSAPPNSVEVNSSNSFGQSFVPNFDNLFMMSIFISEQNLTEDDELLFHLKNNKDDDRDLVTLKWKSSQIRPIENSFYLVHPPQRPDDKGFHFHFHFPSISSSKGREFYFYFESPNAEAGKGIKLGVWDNRRYYNALTKGKMHKNHQPISGFLAFRTYNTYKGSLRDVLEVIRERFKRDISFAKAYTCLILAIFAGIIILEATGKLSKRP